MSLEKTQFLTEAIDGRSIRAVRRVQRERRPPLSGLASGGALQNRVRVKYATDLMANQSTVAFTVAE
mgnify:CR=1 FL=1